MFIAAIMIEKSNLSYTLKRVNLTIGPPGVMNLKKHGIIVDCEHCKYNSSDDRGVFDITVPIIDSETGISSPAKLRCMVSPERHTVELQEWHEINRQPSRSIERLQQRISAVLNFIANRQVCGNRHICPSEVIQIAEKSSNS